MLRRRIGFDLGLNQNVSVSSNNNGCVSKWLPRSVSFLPCDCEHVLVVRDASNPACVMMADQPFDVSTGCPLRSIVAGPAVRFAILIPLSATLGVKASAAPTTHAISR